jgi:Tol biopolymer transport system component
VSVGSSGVQADGESESVAVSADARFVAFASAALNLVPGTRTGRLDVFVRDRLSGTTERVSVDSSGAQASLASKLAGISADGRYVCFVSAAPDLVPGDANGSDDVFLRDRTNGSTERVSLTAAGGEANGASPHASLSGDGRVVAFGSNATNLVTGDTNGRMDVFVRDLDNGTTVRASVDPQGVEADDDSTVSSVSGDGRYVAFRSHATNLRLPYTYGAWAHLGPRPGDRDARPRERVALRDRGELRQRHALDLGRRPDGRLHEPRREHRLRRLAITRST